jgi:uncharacterized protein
MKNHLRKVLLTTTLILVIIAIYSLIEPYWIETKFNSISSSKFTADFHALKIVFISDIHHGPFFNETRVRRLVTKINKLKPDVVILGGDYVHRDKKYIAGCFNELKHLNPTYGTYVVLGNHDHWESKETTIQNIKQSNFHLIDNSAEWLNVDNNRIRIGGVGDYVTDHQDISPTICDTTEKDFVILVTHNPDYVEEISKHESFDLVCAGHTHGGQITLFGLYSPVLPSRYGQKYRTGLIKIGNMNVIVSNGIGTITPPIRFFARPQINVIVLRTK